MRLLLRTGSTNVVTWSAGTSGKQEQRCCSRNGKKRTLMGIFASKRTSNKANIVFVHGFWADGSGWSKVIPTLQAQGHFVVAAQHAHTSLADDVAATRHLLAELEGPTLLVGHSYGGFRTSQAAPSAPPVARVSF